MSHFVVIDLEMCKVSREKRKQYNYASEIIQIGAVLLDSSLQITDEFKTFVSPEYGKIDSYIENLTKIKNKDVCSAPVLRDALKMFFEWLPDDTTMIAWSDNDAFQLKAETLRKGIKSAQLDSLLKTSIDCQIMFSEKMKSSKIYSLSEALIIASIEYDDGAHDALVDAHNTALLFEKIMNDKEFKLNPYYTNRDNNTSAYCPFADLFTNFSFAV